MNNFTPVVIRILRKHGWQFLRHGMATTTFGAIRGPVAKSR
jgi:hypothetical protein